jgi:hypothetical protein
MVIVADPSAFFYLNWAGYEPQMNPYQQHQSPLAQLNQQSPEYTPHFYANNNQPAQQQYMQVLLLVFIFYYFITSASHV